MAAEIIPSEKGTKEATFTCLSKDFNLDDKVLALLMASPMDNLEDFRFYFTEEKEVDAFVGQDAALKDQQLRIQVARFRRAWASVRQMALRREARQSTSTVAELDDLLCEVDLRNAKVQFWMRYKLRYPANITPCDQIISRCYRELDRRLLTVYDIWKVRSLKHQVTTTRKRKQVGDGLFTFEEDVHAEASRTVSVYMANLHTYLLALAITGTTKMSDAPEKETFGSDPLKFVAAPWDILESYYFRAVESIAAIPEVSRMAWLERADLAERAVWVSTFRDGEDTIGEVIKQTMDRRGAHWDPPALPQQTHHQQQPQRREQQQQPQRGQSGKGGKQEQARPSGQQSGQAQQQPRLVPGSVAAELRSGSKLCPDFQKGYCKVKGPQCPKGLHKCGHVTAKGKICGMNFHGASKCKVK
jgi:hypothetical protein